MENQDTRAQIVALLDEGQRLFADGDYAQAESTFSHAHDLVERQMAKDPQGDYVSEYRESRDGFVLAYENNPKDASYYLFVIGGIYFEHKLFRNLNPHNDRDVFALFDELLFLSEHLYIEETGVSQKTEISKDLQGFQDELSHIIPVEKDQEKHWLYTVYQDGISCFRMLFDNNDADFFLLMSSLANDLATLSSKSRHCPLSQRAKQSLLFLLNLSERKNGQKAQERPNWIISLRHYLGEDHHQEA